MASLKSGLIFYIVPHMVPWRIESYFIRMGSICGVLPFYPESVVNQTILSQAFDALDWLVVAAYPVLSQFDRRRKLQRVVPFWKWCWGPTDYSMRDPNFFLDWIFRGAILTLSWFKYARGSGRVVTVERYFSRSPLTYFGGSPVR